MQNLAIFSNLNYHIVISKKFVCAAKPPMLQEFILIKMMKCAILFISNMNDLNIMFKSITILCKT